MIAKFFFAASICFSFFIMPYFWQQHSDYLSYSALLSEKMDSIYAQTHHFYKDKLAEYIRANPKYQMYKSKNDSVLMNLENFLKIVDKKSIAIDKKQSLTQSSIDSLVDESYSLWGRFLGFFDERDKEDWVNKLPYTNSMWYNIPKHLQKIYLQNIKNQANINSLCFNMYALEKSSGCDVIFGSPHTTSFYTNTFDKYKIKYNIFLTDDLQSPARDSIWVNGVLGNRYTFTPRKTGYHYLTVKAKIQDNMGQNIVLRDTFKVHIAR